MQRYPSAPSYWFKPLHFHFDDGFGALGDAFQEAALCLEGLLEEKQFINSYLPLAYLYRHAVELYLKSLIIIVHRALRLPFGTQPSSAPASIQTEEGWTPISFVHSVSKLYGYLKTLIDANRRELLVASKSDCIPLPEELPHWIALIETFDRRSTFFRYPGVGGAEQAPFRGSSSGAILSSEAPEPRPTEASIGFNEGEQVIGVFYRDRSGLNDLLAVLKSAADELSILHFGLRCDLAGGE
ncbi:MAG: hypothetical protein QHH30_08705 [candidate division NC10 bacterium]|nr:hypothetical protein [candidate division NC10 bacterium]